MRKSHERPHNQTQYGEALVPLTLEVAKRLTWRTELHHATQKDSQGWPVKARVNASRAQTWRDPSRVRIPTKFGLRTCFAITEDDLGEWMVTKAVANRPNEEELP